MEYRVLLMKSLLGNKFLMFVTFLECLSCFRAKEIEELKLIDKQSSSSQQRSTITIAKPIAKRAARTQSTSDVTNSIIKHTNANGSHSKSKPIDIEPKNNNYNFNESNSFKSGTPNKKEKSKGKWSKGWKDEECFGSPLDPKINKDFDFEKNLALFDKQAIWDEINNSQKPDVIKNLDSKKPSKYRFVPYFL
jgi:enhancer of mRNA-decapping protein 3